MRNLIFLLTWDISLLHCILVEVTWCFSIVGFIVIYNSKRRYVWVRRECPNVESCFTFSWLPLQRRGNYIWLCLSVCSHRMLASCPLAIHCRPKPSQDKMACELLISLDLLRLIPMTVHQYAKIHSISDGLLVFEVCSCQAGMLSTFYILYPPHPFKIRWVAGVRST